MNESMFNIILALLQEDVKRFFSPVVLPGGETKLKTHVVNAEISLAAVVVIGVKEKIGELTAFPHVLDQL